MKKKDLYEDSIYIAEHNRDSSKYFVTGDLSSYCQFDSPTFITSNFSDMLGNYSYELASVSDAKWFKACIKEGKILPKVLTKKDLNPELIYVATGESSSKYFVKGDLSHYTSNKNFGLTKNFLDSGGYTYELASSTDTLWFNEKLYGVNNQSKDFKVAANSYIVVLKLNRTGTKCAKEDYIFKQRETLDYIAPCVDLTGSTTNDNNYLLFNKSKMLADWRYATDKEVELYESVGKPCSIHDVKPSTLVKFEVGKWYKNLSKHNFIAKFVKLDHNTSFISDGYFISEGKYKKSSCGGNITADYNNAVECSLEEIQQYLPEGHPDKINKKWSIGTYVVFIALFGGSKKGDIDKITGTSGTDGLWCEKEKVTTKDPYYVKWFATYKEAEAFSKTLVEHPKEQSLEEILEICKQKYPIGTEIISTLGSEAIVETEPYINPMSNSISVNKCSKIVYDFDTKEYAKIVGSASNIELKDITFHEKPVTLQKTKPSDDLEFQQANIIKTKQKKNKLIIINQ